MQLDRLNRKLEGLEKASKDGHRVKDLYRMMYLSEIWQEAYANIYSNKGALTKGTDDVTLDGMSHERISSIIEKLKAGDYRFRPVRRIHIPKRNGQRPLGIPSGDDKLVQEVARIILERIYEPIFSNNSHGFRPNRSCHTALQQVQKVWTGIKWFCEFDIKSFFNSMDHGILVGLLEKKIDDKCFIRLIKGMLKAGYLEEWQYHQTYSGCPQGGIISPILSNIYLHELDQFVTELAKQFNEGESRPVDPRYQKVRRAKHRLRKKIDREGKKPELVAKFLELDRQLKELPYGDPYSQNYKRLRYCRYADDFICGIIGSKSDVKEIKDLVIQFLQTQLNLQVAENKTNIRSAKEGVQFLSYEIRTWRTNKIMKVKYHGTYATQRTVKEGIQLIVPVHKTIEFCNKYGYGDWYRLKPLHRVRLIYYPDIEIINIYNVELRGLANYYSLAYDMKRKLNRLQYLSNYSLIKTLAYRHKTKMSSILRQLKQGNEWIHKYRSRGNDYEMKVFKLRHMVKPEKDWEIDNIPNTFCLISTESELIKRLNARVCEYCGRDDLPVEVHHVRKLKDLRRNHNLEHWQKVMIARNRKTMILCSGTPDSCHSLLHAGKLPDKRFNSKWF